MVGDSLPGSSNRIAGNALRGACSMMYLLSRTCCTPSMRSNMRSTQVALASGSPTGVCTSTAWLSITVATSYRRLAIRVEPVDTRSQMASARPSLGAISTAPESVTISALTPCSPSQRLSVNG